MVTTLTGGNSFGLRSTLSQLKADFIKKHGDLAVEKISAEALSEADLISTLSNLPFLADKKLVILTELTQNKALADNFEQVISALPETTELIIVEAVLDKRLKLYKQLSKLTDFKEFNEPDNISLQKWLVDYVKAEGGQISQADAAYLIEKVGPSQRLLASEADKLTLFDPHISRGSIDALVEASPQSTIFQLIEAALRGQAGKAITIYREQRQSKITARELIALMTWQLHLLAVVKSAGTLSSSQIARQAGLNPYAISKAQATARGLSLSRLKALIRQLLNIDLVSKQSALDLDEAIENYILALAGVIA